MSTVGHWVAADAGGAGTSVPDRSPLNLDGTLSAGCTWETVAGEAAVRCPGADRVDVPATFPEVHLYGSQHAVWVRFALHALAGQPGLLARSGGPGPVMKWLFSYKVSTQQIEVFTPGNTLWTTVVPLTIDTVYVLAARRTLNGGAYALAVYDAAGAILASGTVQDARQGAPLTGQVLSLAWGGETFFNGDVALVAARIEDTEIDAATLDVIAAHPALEGTVPPALPPPTPGATGLIAHFVAADAEGVGDLLPDRALGNHGAIQDNPGMSWNPRWDHDDSGCAVWSTSPTSGTGGGLPGGVIAKALPAYDVTDFTLLACVEAAGGHPFSHSHYGVVERLNVKSDPGAGSGAGPWWAFGIRNAGLGGINPVTRFRHSDGVTSESLESPPWPVPMFVTMGAGAPGGGGDTMSTKACIGLTRAGMTFTFFLKVAVFRRSTEQCIDPVTGAPETVPAALVLGTVTGTLVSGAPVTAPLRLFSSVDINSFGSSMAGSWVIQWNRALAPAAVLDIMDTQYDACGTVLIAPLPLAVSALACVVTPFCPEDEEP